MSRCTFRPLVLSLLSRCCRCRCLRREVDHLDTAKEMAPIRLNLFFIRRPDIPPPLNNITPNTLP